MSAARNGRRKVSGLSGWNASSPTNQGAAHRRRSDELLAATPLRSPEPSAPVGGGRSSPATHGDAAASPVPAASSLNPARGGPPAHLRHQQARDSWRDRGRQAKLPPGVVRVRHPNQRRGRQRGQRGGKEPSAIARGNTGPRGVGSQHAAASEPGGAPSPQRTPDRATSHAVDAYARTVPASPLVSPGSEASAAAAAAASAVRRAQAEGEGQHPGQHPAPRPHTAGHGRRKSAGPAVRRRGRPSTSSGRKACGSASVGGLHRRPSRSLVRMARLMDALGSRGIVAARHNLVRPRNEPMELPKERAAAPRRRSRSPSRDVSYNTDTAQHGRTPPRPTSPEEQRQQRVAFNRTIPQTQVPAQDHIVETTTLTPNVNEAQDYVYDANKRVWMKQVFPSLAPAGRQDVVMLDKWLAAHERMAALESGEAGDPADAARVEVPGYHFGGKSIKHDPATTALAQTTPVPFTRRQSAAAGGRRPVTSSAARKASTQSAAVGGRQGRRTPGNRVASAPPRRRTAPSAPFPTPRLQGDEAFLSPLMPKRTESPATSQSLTSAGAARLSEYSWLQPGPAPSFDTVDHPMTKPFAASSTGSTQLPPPSLAGTDTGFDASVADSVPEARPSLHIPDNRPPMQGTQSELSLLIAARKTTPTVALEGQEREARDALLVGMMAAKTPTPQHKRDGAAHAQGQAHSQAHSHAQGGGGVDGDALVAALQREQARQEVAGGSGSLVSDVEPFDPDASSAFVGHTQSSFFVDEEGEETLAMLHRIRHSQAAYAVTFNEIVRQVSVGCVERGQLLAKVWHQYLALFNQLVQLMSPLRQRVRDLEQCLHDASEQVASLKLEGTARVGVMRRLEKQLLDAEVYAATLHDSIAERDQANEALANDLAYVKEELSTMSLSKQPVEDEGDEEATLKERLATASDELEAAHSQIEELSLKLSHQKQQSEAALKAAIREAQIANAGNQQAKQQRWEDTKSKNEAGAARWNQLQEIANLKGEIQDLKDRLVENGISPMRTGGKSFQLKRGYSDSRLLRGRSKNRRRSGSTAGGGEGDSVLGSARSRNRRRPGSANSDCRDDQGSAADLARSELMLRNVQEQLMRMRKVTASLQGDLRTKTSQMKAMKDQLDRIDPNLCQDMGVSDIAVSDSLEKALASIDQERRMVRGNTRTQETQTDGGGRRGRGGRGAGFGAGAGAQGGAGGDGGPGARGRRRRMRLGMGGGGGVGGGAGKGRGRRRRSQSPVPFTLDWTDDEGGDESGGDASDANLPAFGAGEPGKARKLRPKRPKPVIPQFWQSLLASMPSSAGAARAWSLPRFRRIILDCYIEKIKFDGNDLENADGKHQKISTFVVQFFYMRFGVKLLVQKRLREMLASIRAHRGDDRVQLFARACGLWDPLPQATLDYFMATLSAVMMDQLQAGSEGRRQGWLVTIDGHTWVPLRACKVVTRRQFTAAPERQREALDKLEALPPVGMDLVRRSKISEAVAKIGGAKVDLDAFLGIMLATWEAEANALREQWAQVYFMVDVDGNQQLDFDEFKHAMSMIKGVELSDARVQSIFVESMGQGGGDFIDLQQFIDVVQRHNFRFASLGAAESDTESIGDVADLPARPTTPDRMHAVPQTRARRRSSSTGMQRRSRSRSVTRPYSAVSTATRASGDSASHAARSQHLSSTGALAGLQSQLVDAGDELTELMEIWEDLAPQVDEQIQAPFQSPATRYLLMHKRDLINEQIKVLQEVVVRQQQASSREEDAEVALRDAEAAKSAWAVFRELVRAVQNSIRRGRLRAANKMKNILREQIQRRRARRQQAGATGGGGGGGGERGAGLSIDTSDAATESTAAFRAVNGGRVTPIATVNDIKEVVGSMAAKGLRTPVARTDRIAGAMADLDHVERRARRASVHVEAAVANATAIAAVMSPDHGGHDKAKAAKRRAAEALKEIDAHQRAAVAMEAAAFASALGVRAKASGGDL